jgi:hypothetical protein
MLRHGLVQVRVGAEGAPSARNPKVVEVPAAGAPPEAGC